MRPRLLTALRAQTQAFQEDHLRRGSLVLMLNAAMLASLGFVFWVVGARLYEEAAVGVLAGVNAGSLLLASVAALGLQNTLMRHLSTSAWARELAVTGVVAIFLLGSVLCTAFVLIFGGILPEPLSLQSGGPEGISMVVLAVLVSVGGTIEGGMVALRTTGKVVQKNLAGSIVKLAAVAAFGLTGFLGDYGLILAYMTGAVVSAVIGGQMLWSELGGGLPRLGGVSLLRRYASFSLGSHAGLILGILPATGVALMVLSIRGATEAAWYAGASMVASTIAVVPQTTCQALFAEVGRTTGSVDSHLRKAVRHIYTFITPMVIVAVVAAPWILSIYGASYAEEGTGVLRLLALAALFTGAGYVVDTLLNARDHVRAYIAMNGINAALVLVFVGILLPYGLTAGAAGWLLAQATSLVIGIALLNATGVWKISSARLTPAVGNLGAVAVMAILAVGGWTAWSAVADERPAAAPDPPPAERFALDVAAAEDEDESTPAVEAPPASAPGRQGPGAELIRIVAALGAPAARTSPETNHDDAPEIAEDDAPEPADTPAEPAPPEPASSPPASSPPPPAPAPAAAPQARRVPAPEPRPTPVARAAPPPARPAPSPPRSVPATASGVLALPASPDAPPG